MTDRLHIEGILELAYGGGRAQVIGERLPCFIAERAVGKNIFDAPLDSLFIHVAGILIQNASRMVFHQAPQLCKSFFSCIALEMI